MSFEAIDLELPNLLDKDERGFIKDLFQKTLIDPVEELLARPSKALRSDLVRIGFDLAALQTIENRENLLAGCTRLIELIHAGSLIVDDIQDESKVRRGGKTLHEIYGVPVALNAGNWLYFWPLEKLSQLEMDPRVKVRLYEECHKMILNAHFGQALDVGSDLRNLPREQIPEVAMAAIELKTGALTSFALRLGSIVSGKKDSFLPSMDRFGRMFGVSLQLADDLGNLTSLQAPAKKFEDIRLGRPGLLWALAALNLSEKDYKQFIRLADDLPFSADNLAESIRKWGLESKAGVFVEEYLEKSLESSRELFLEAPPVFKNLVTLYEKLRFAYV